MTAGREDGTAGARGQLKTSRADRNQAVDLLKDAFVAGRLAKDEFDLRVGQVLASRTYADLAALTSDVPPRVAGAELSDEDAREPERALSVKTAARVGAVGAAPSMASATLVLAQSSGVPAVVGVVLVGVTGLVAAALLATLLIALSWVVRRSQREPGQGPPSGGAGLASRRPTRALPSARRDPRQGAEAAGFACGLARSGGRPWRAATSPARRPGTACSRARPCGRPRSSSPLRRPGS